MSKILNIETATNVCSVCIAINGKVVSIAEDNEGFSHASKLTLLIQECLKSATMKMDDLDAVALSQGPGSYTGLRIGVSVAKGICYALNKPMIAVDTLQAIALACAIEEKDAEALYCPMIDARRMEVYTALYDFNNNEVSSIEAKIINEASYQSYFEANQKIIFCGNGAEKCQEMITSNQAKFTSTLCSSSHLATLSNAKFKNQTFEDIGYFSPLYFKAPNITISKQTL